MSSQREDQQIRDFLHDDIVCSDDEDGFVEYGDAGVWITDKAVEKFKSIVSHQAREHELKILKELLGEPDLKGNIQWRIAGLEATLERSSDE